MSSSSLLLLQIPVDRIELLDLRRVFLLLLLLLLVDCVGGIDILAGFRSVLLSVVVEVVSMAVAFSALTFESKATLLTFALAIVDCAAFGVACCSLVVGGGGGGVISKLTVLELAPPLPAPMPVNTCANEFDTVEALRLPPLALSAAAAAAVMLLLLASDDLRV
jgi:hypothetical protein